MGLLEDWLGNDENVLSDRQGALTEIELQNQGTLQDQGNAIIDLFGSDFLGTGGYTPLDVLVPFNEDQLASQDALRTAADQMTGLNQTTLDAINFGLTGVLDPASSDYFNDALAAMLDPIYAELTEKVLPGVTSASIQGGAYGGSRDAFLTAEAINDYNTLAANTGAELANDWYLAGLNTFNSTMGLLPSTLETLGMGGELLGQVGDDIADYENALRQQDIDEFNFYRDQPLENAESLSNILDTLFESPELLWSEFAAPPTGYVDQDGNWVPINDEGLSGDIADVIGVLEGLGISIGGEGTNITIDNTIDSAIDAVVEGGDQILNAMLEGLFGEGGSNIDDFWDWLPF